MTLLLDKLKLYIKMTILNLHKCYPHYFKLTFGVPLEDVFPDGDIHPTLKELLVEIFNNLACDKLPLEYILRCKSCPPEKLHVEDALNFCRSIDCFPAGSMLWLLRHFLGSLPLPLFPSFTNKTHFTWRSLSDRCRHDIQHYLQYRKNNEYLINVLSDELLRLPPVNLLLIGYLVNFLRSLVLCTNKGCRINKKAAVTLVRYFGCSIFVRPYKPHQEFKGGKTYRPLMLYLLINWPEIQLNCMQKHPHCFVPVGKRVNLYPRDDDYATQTTKELTVIEEGINIDLNAIEEEDPETISNSDCESFVTVPDLRYFKEAGCQTQVKTLRTLSTQTRPDSITVHTSTCNKCNILKSVATQTEDIFEDSTSDSKESQTSLFEKGKVSKIVKQLNATIESLQTSYSKPKIEESNPIGPDGSSFKIDHFIKTNSDKPSSRASTSCDDNDIPQSLPSTSNLNNADFHETDAQTPLQPRTKRNSLTRLKSKLDFLKLFKDRKLDSSSSVCYFGSKVRYEKMRSSKSNVF